MAHPCDVYRLGIVPYPQSWHLQDQLAFEIAANKRPATLLLLQHPHTYTFGRRGQIKNLIWDKDELERRKISVLWVDRGGDVTYHGPGQLVGYPLIPLETSGLVVTNEAARLPQADYVGFVRKIEQSLMTALAHLGVVSQQQNGLTGVWVQPHSISRLIGHPIQPDLAQPPAKIAAIGIKVDANGVTRHGFGLNVNPDMTYWQGIIACGLVGYPVTCLASLRDPCPTIDQVEEAIISAFGKVFQFQMRIASLDLPDEFQQYRVG